jgi:3-hydroxybutyryl-CoA dehydrogenase
MIQTICVCGAGTMGRGIAQVSAMAGFRTLLYDIDPGAVQKARMGIENSLHISVEKNKISPGEKESAMGRIQGVGDYRDCVADLIIEAILEKEDAKADLFNKLAYHNSQDTILATNTSSLSVTSIANKIDRPQQFLGLHFFNPAPVMKLVEVVITGYTLNEIVGTILELVPQMGKTPVLCKDAPGFIVNRVARPYYLESLRLVEQGLCGIEELDQLMEASGFKMGPFRLMDLIGNDINYEVSRSIYEAMNKPERLQPSSIQKRKVEQGQWGRKTGRGYYEYPK